MLNDISRQRAERWVNKALSNQGKWIHMSRKNENTEERQKVFNAVMEMFKIMGIEVTIHYKTKFRFKVNT